MLAAGAGLRLGASADGHPKCLQRVGDRTILEIQLDILAAVGLSEVCVVAGYESDQVRAAVGRRPGCSVIENARYAETNSLYSLWLARTRIQGPCVCLNGDVIAHPDVFHRVLAVEGCALAYDSRSGQDEEHMKVSVDGPFLRAMSKQLGAEDTHGENVGLLQFDADGAARLIRVLDRMVAEGGHNCWAPAAFAEVGATHPIRCVDIAGLPWIEIDYPEDLAAARSSVWPAIARLIPDRSNIQTVPARLAWSNGAKHVQRAI